jgi:hypothetical protein
MGAETHIVTVAENITCVESTVALGTTPRPEAALFDSLATFLASQPTRQAILGGTFYYDDTESSFVAVLFLGESIEDDDN